MNNKNMKGILVCVIVLLTAIVILLSMLVALNLKDNATFENREESRVNESFEEKTTRSKEPEERAPATNTDSKAVVKENEKSEDKSSDLAYLKYKNQRYGYTISYPDFLIPQGESDNGDGQSFISADGEVKLIVWGSWGPMVMDETPTLDELYQETLNDLDYVPTYKFKKNNTFVFSGNRGDTVIYQRHFLKTDGSENVFVIEYPLSREKELDSIISKISNTMSTGVGFDSVCEK